MARLTRKNIKVFAENAANNGVFGSLQAGNPVTTTNVEQVQSLPAWSAGWNSATMTSEKLPPLEEFQGIQYVTTYQQAYIMQEGIPEWASTVTYYKGSLAKEVTANGFRIYNSLTDNNENNLLSDTSNWKKVMDSEDVYAFDSDVVHIAGAETITGTKTVANNANPSFIIQNTQYAYSDSQSEYAYFGIDFQDKNGQRIGKVEPYYMGSGAIGMNLSVSTVVGGSIRYGALTVEIDENGQATTAAPTPTDTTTTNSNKIATTGWVNSTGNNLVHLTNDETITGQKTLQDSMLIFKTTNTAYNETPTTNQYAGYSWKDKNGAEISAFYSALYASRLGITGGLSGFNLTNKSGNSELVCLRYDSNGNFFTQAPASDVANSIVTTVNKSKAANGYFQLGNGLIVQWGRTKISVITGETKTPVTTITFPKAFTTTNYSLTGTFENNTSTAPEHTDDVTFCTKAIYTTSANVFGYDAGGNTYEAYLRWIAIGY